MAIVYSTLKGWKFEDSRHEYTEKDAMLYALSLGLGEEPTDPAQLRYVYEKDLRSFPTLAVIIGYPGFWLRDERTGVDWVKTVHGEQRLSILKDLPAAGAVHARHRVTHVVDKGPGRGALVITERRLHDAGTDELLAVASQTSFCRADGGFGTGDASPPALAPLPERPAERTCQLTVSARSALLYRLNGDINPLHADPEVARLAGYPRPILHGLCTYGMAARGLLRIYGHDRRLSEFNARFSAPVYPGETLQVDCWDEPDGSTRFRATVPERGQMVLSHGYAAWARRHT